MRALITGITGQDGSYLAELLLSKGYDVHGIIRRSSSFNTGRIDHVFDKLKLHHGDMLDGTSLRRIVSEVQPDEVYNLAAQSHVKVSFEEPEYTLDSIATGTLRLLEAIRHLKEDCCRSLHVRMYQASSSEMFGSSAPPQGLHTRFKPRSPYGVAKLAAHEMCINYRESYGLHVSCGILFNHESPRRGETFVTRKITRAIGRITYGLQGSVVLGNLDARRDWGHARDYVEAMWLMLQSDEPRDHVVATGESHSVQEFLDEAFSYANLARRNRVLVDPKYTRPAEVDSLRGICTLDNWKPKTTFKQLVKEMVDHDMYLASTEA